MGLIPEDIIGEIRQRADIVAVIGRHVQLRKAGHNHKGLCPFHQEKTPSFNVNPAKGFFYCFGCQKKGDVFTFVMEYEGKSFLEAAESLAQLTGVTLPERTENPAAQRAMAEARSERSQMYRINQAAAGFFRRQLAGPGGAAARAYLAERGVSEATAEAFQLGYAPDAWSALADFLAGEKLPLRLAEAVGLIAPRRQAGGYYDRFRHRLICPVVLATGEVAGFSARALPGATVTGGGGEAPAKYINSPESPVYKKSRLLYGLHQALPGMRARRRAVLVEGNFDVISMHQAGITETVAPLGTALTEEQVELLRRLAESVVLLYDGDKAGRAATLKALRLLVAGGVEARIAPTPWSRPDLVRPGDDPDTLAQRGGPEVVAALVDRARPALDFFVEEVWALDRSSAGYATSIREAAALLPSVKDDLRRTHLVDRLAGALGVPVERLRADLRAAYRGQKLDGGPTTGRQSRSSRPLPGPGPRPQHQPLPPIDEMDLLAYLVEFPELMPVAEDLDVLSLLTDSRLRDMYSAASGGRPIWSSAPEMSPEIAAHVLSGAKKSVANPELALREAVGNLKTRREKEKRLKLARQLAEAERRRDDALARELISRVRETRQPKD